MDTLEMPVARREPRTEPSRTPTPERRGPRAPVAVAVLAAAALAGAAVGLGGLSALGSLGAGQSAGSSQQEPGAALDPASVDSFDPSGGSGFAQGDDGTWRTQTYRTAEFGNLKEGVGLVVDLGTPRDVSAVTLDGATPGLVVELRSGDERSATADGYGAVDSTRTSGEPTVLEAGDAPTSRYWLVWVTTLAPSGDGFAGEIGGLTVSGTAD